MFLIDSSIWIRYLRNPEESQKNKNVKRYFLDPLQNLEIATCGIILYELSQGVKNKNQEEDLNTIKATCTFVDLYEDDFLYGGEISRKLIKKNQFLPMADIMLAVTAMKNKMILLSADKHFERIEKVEPKFLWKYIPV